MGRGFRLWIMVLIKIYPHYVDEFTGCWSGLNFGQMKCEKEFPFSILDFVFKFFSVQCLFNSVELSSLIAVF